MSALELAGWIGSGLFALCGVPQAWQCWKQKHSDGLSWSFLWMWFWGEVLTLFYVTQKDDVLPLIANYCFNLVLVGVMLWYKIWPNRGDTK